jgi:hypothetical protein
MVLKKLGEELRGEFVDVLHYLGNECGVRVLIEPHEHEKLVSEEMGCSRVSSFGLPPLFPRHFASLSSLEADTTGNAM